MEVTFYYGALSDIFEKQANDQGLTLGNKAAYFERAKRSYNFLRINGYITDSQADKIMQKIQKDLIKHLRKIDKE